MARSTSSAASSPTGTARWPLSIRYISGAVVLKPSFQPGNGYAIALSTTPRARLISIGLPTQPEQPYRVSLARPGDGRDVREVVALINSSGTLIELIDPRRFAPAQTVLAWQHAIHFGQGLGWVWRVLVCVSGLLPAIFAFTGLAMWLITRRTRRRIVPLLAE